MIIEDHVFDISSFKHPKGQYILESISGKDITREIMGMKKFWYESKNRSYVKMLRHHHNDKVMKQLAMNCVGPLHSQEELICELKDNFGEPSQLSFDLGMLDHNVSYF